MDYINSLELKDPSGNKLSLTSTNAGSYYDYLKNIIEESLNNFLSDNTFPWTREAEKEFPRGGMRRLDSEAVTYNTVNEYINYLNSDYNWVTYDSSTNKATITNVGDFVKKLKPPSKDVGAFDDLNRNQGENKVFGTKPGEYLKHFDQIINNLIKMF